MHTVYIKCTVTSNAPRMLNIIHDIIYDGEPVLIRFRSWTIQPPEGLPADLSKKATRIQVLLGSQYYVSLCQQCMVISTCMQISIL